MLKPTVGTVINAKIDQVFSRLIEMRKKKQNYALLLNPTIVVPVVVKAG